MPLPAVVQCIQASIECASACDAFVSTPLAEPERLRVARAVSLAMDCTELCYELVRLIQSDSDMLSAHCLLLAECCESCAKECRNLDCALIPFQTCAEACESCAKACLTVTGSLVGANT